MPDDKYSLTRELTDYIHGVRFDAIPANVIARAKEAVTDGIGVTLSGYSADCTSLIRKYICGLGLDGKCTVMGQ